MPEPSGQILPGYKFESQEITNVCAGCQTRIIKCCLCSYDSRADQARDNMKRRYE